MYVTNALLLKSSQVLWCHHYHYYTIYHYHYVTINASIVVTNQPCTHR